MSFLRSQIKEQKILEMEVDFDKFISDNNITENSMIHTMIFDKSVFVEEKEVREYLKDKYFYDPKITEDEKSFIATMLAPSQIDEETEVEVELRRGIIAKAADLMPIMVFEEMQFNDKGEINLSSKFNTINLHEGLPHIIEIARVSEGEHPSYGKIKITQENLESMELNFKSRVTGVDLSVNEDHKKNEAFGWFKDVFLSFDKQTLYGQINWNTKGTAALSEKEYRYFSPEFRFNYKHPHTGTEHGPTLLGGALTNYPFLKMEAITELNNKPKTKEVIVSTEQTVNLSVHNEKIIELSGKITEVTSKLDASEARGIELSNKVEELEKEIELSAKKSVHEKLFAEGKINKAQLDAMNEGKGMLEVIALSEKMNTKAKGKDNSTVSVTVELSEKEKRIVDSLGLTPEEYNIAN
jgi:phage I-like protein